jgi:CSLREA domain-containing protein
MRYEAKERQVSVKLLRRLTLIMVTSVVALVASPAWASTITVNSLQDTTANDGNCTLREAITAANTSTASGLLLESVRLALGATL